MKKGHLKLIGLISSSVLTCTLMTAPIKSQAKISTPTRQILSSSPFLAIMGMSTIYLAGTGAMIANIVATNERLKK